jgi:hypothetical protein
MNDLPTNADRLLSLAGAVCNGTASESDFAELNGILQTDHDSQLQYLDYCELHASLRLQMRARRAAQKVCRQTVGGDRPVPLQPHEADPVPGQCPPAALPGFPTTPLHTTFGIFSPSWPVAYLIASVIFAIGLVIGGMIHVSQSTQNPNRSPSVATQGLPEPSPQMDSVGRITGMVDCAWEGSGASSQKPLVQLGDRLSLRSGLLEITYDSGATVILQGPVVYRVESPTSGYLAVGKLTAKLEKRSEVAGQKSESANQKSPIINHQFAVRTPTATVTDLGTEFGVEVDRQGYTTSYVFRGAVHVQPAAAADQTEKPGRVLHATESIRVTDDRAAPMSAAPNAAPAQFIRRLPKPSIKTLDLVDLIAGGDGFSGKRGRWLDPTTGRISDSQPGKIDARGDYMYHRVEGIPLVDGIFIPDASRGPVQVSSAGHVFADCPATDNLSWLNVWGGGELPRSVAERLSRDLAGVDYFSPDHSALFMHANKGLTFDLDAIRRQYADNKILRFRAVAGNMEPESEKGDRVCADVWVLVDGKVRFKRREVTRFLGAMHIDIALAPSDRFLTLAATDGGDSYSCDQIIFGDPQLELVEKK